MCRSIREAGAGFDGLRFVRPPVQYDHWDADRITGCLCDPGYAGVACERRSCPYGLDPLDPDNAFAKPETFEIQCRANAGHFSLQVLGRATEPIPWDADASTLRLLLRRALHISEKDNAEPVRIGQYLVGDVSVEMDAFNTTLLSQVCRSDAVAVTRVRLSQRPGALPPMQVLRRTANTRRTPSGSVSLTLHGAESAATLQLVSRHVLRCPACGFGRYCHQALVHLSYLHELSVAVNVSASDATRQLKDAVSQLETLQRAGYTGLSVTVNRFGAPAEEEGPLCRAEEDTEIEVLLASDYGNVHPPLQLLVTDALPDPASSAERIRLLNLTFSDQTGNGTLLECSGQGLCDIGSGLCKCLQQYDLSLQRFDFSISHSNGFRDSARHKQGGTGDCGFVSTGLDTCVNAISLTRRLTDQAPCSGHGRCVNLTTTFSSSTYDPVFIPGSVQCECEAGYLGIDCSLRICPLGTAFFDEPLLNDTAHRRTQECAGNGDCDRASGTCRCRAGFSGANCERKDCVSDDCTGRGRCLSMRRLFASYGFSYGNLSLGHADTGVALASTASALRYFSAAGGANAAAMYAAYADTARASIAGGAWDADLWHECVCTASLPLDKAYDGGRSLVADPYSPVTGPR